MCQLQLSKDMSANQQVILKARERQASPCLGDFGTIQFWQLGVMQSILAFGVLIAALRLDWIFPCLVYFESTGGFCG